MATVFLIGDSTVDNFHPPFRGWGWSFPQFVREGIEVQNHALSGRSSKSFYNEGLFQPVEEALQPGDLLLIQFGHNDEKDDEERHTDPDSTFPQMLLYYITAARRKGALPVLITPVSRRFFAGATSLLYTHGEYPLAIRNLARRESVILCDLERSSRKLYLELGEEKTAELFVRLQPGEHPDYPQGHDDRTHFCAEGSRVIAELVARELRQHPLCAPYLKLF